MVECAQPWDVLDPLVWLAAVALGVAVVTPDGYAALIFVVAVAGGWLLRGTAGPDWSVVVVAVLLVVVHLASAFAAQLPSYAEADPGLLRRWLPPATVAAGTAVLGAVGAVLVRNGELPGSLAITVGALAAVTALAWFAAARPSR